MLKYVSPTIIITFGTTLALGGIFASTFVTNFYAFMILFGFYYGVGIGVCYLVPLACTWEYFPKRKGLISGIIIGGFGFGAFFFGFISFALVNPENAEPDVEVDGGKIFGPDTTQAQLAPRMIRINCAIWLVMVLISIALIRRKQPEQIVRVRGGHVPLRQGNEEETLMTSNQILSSEPEDAINVTQTTQPIIPIASPVLEVSFKDALRDSRTWMVTVMFLFSQVQGILIGYIFKSYGLKNIPDDAFVTVVGTIGAVSNGISRSFWANLLDRFSLRYVYGSLLIIQIIIGFTMSSIVSIRPLFLIWVMASYFCLGGHFSMAPTI